MPGVNLIKLSAIFTLAAACSSDGTLAPPTGLPHAVATQTCGPLDGPATAIYLAGSPVESVEPPAPYVRIAVWYPLEAFRDGSRQFGDDDAAAWYHSAGGNIDIATSVRITVNAVDPDNTIHGSTDLRFSNARRVTGEFRATWIAQSPICG